MNTQQRIHHGLFLSFAMLGCGLLSVCFGKELCWDLAHYHYYSAYAFLHNRNLIDIWPNSYIHQFINPTIDFLSYALITYLTPRTAEFLLGAIHGINLWLLFLIARYFVTEKYQAGIACILALLGMIGPTTLPGIGSFQNDNLICIFVLACILFQLQTLSIYQSRAKLSYGILALSGFCLGLGFGLKLTAAIYIVGVFTANLFLPFSFRQRIEWIFVWGMGVLFGLLITNGYWMLAMWQQHHNPFFPFFNSIFQSTDFGTVNWRDTRFLPHGILQTLFYPFYFSWDGRIADAPFRDFRFPVVYILFIAAGMRMLIQKIWGHNLSTAVPFSAGETHAIADKEASCNQTAHPCAVWSAKADVTLASGSAVVAWLFIFYISSYIVWQYYFSIARYLAALEMLAPLVIYLLVKRLISNSYWRFSILFIIFYTLMITLSPIPMVRARWYDTSFFNVKMPSVVTATPKATVLIAFTAYVKDRDPRPQTYLIPFFPKTWRFVGVPFWNGRYLASQKQTTHIQKAVQKDTNPIFLLTTDVNMPALLQSANNFGLKSAGNCFIIKSDRQRITHQNVLLCPVTRTT